MRLALESKRSSRVLSDAVWRASTRSSEACRRASVPSTPTADGFGRGGDTPRWRRQLARLQPRFAVGRRGKDHRVADRGGLRDLARRRIGHRGRAALDRAGGGRIGHAGERRSARFQRGLPPHDLLELLLELLLVQQLPAGDAVDLGAQLGDAVFIGELLVLLAGDQARQHVVVEGEIGAGGKRPAGHDHQAADRDPEGDWAEAELVAGMRDGVVGSAGAARRRAWAALFGASEPTTRPEFGAMVVNGWPVATSTLPRRQSPLTGARASEGRFQPGMVNFPQTESGKCELR